MSAHEAGKVIEAMFDAEDGVEDESGFNSCEDKELEMEENGEELKEGKSELYEVSIKKEDDYFDAEN